MKVISRKEAAKRLGMSPNALSCHVHRKNWASIPKPVLIGGRLKWTEEQIDKWLRRLFEEAESDAQQPFKSTQKRGPGRPRKTGRAPCS